MAVTIEGEARTRIERPREVIVEWILDLRQYAEADHKFRRIHRVTRDGDRGTAHYSGTLRGLPTPSDHQVWELAPDRSRLTFSSRPGLRTRLLGGFEGWFEFDETDGVTDVRHVERMHIRGPLGRLVGWWAGEWWQREIEAEVERLRQLVEART